MGHEIVYCVHCATRIAGTDFEKGRAFRAGGKNVCADCLPAVLATLPPDEQASAQNPGSSAKLRKHVPPTGASTTRLRRSEPSEKSRTPLIVAGGVGGVVLLGLILAVALRSDPPAPPPETPLPPVDPPRIVVKAETPKEDPQLREAREAIEAARAKSTSAPEDLDAQLAAWEEAARKAALTGYFKEATVTLSGLREKKAALKPPPPKEPDPSVEPVVKPPSPDVKAYLARWEPAMAKASARDFEGAIADLGRAAAELSDDTVKREAREDAERLQRARSLRIDGQAAVSQLARGQAVALRYRSESGEARQIEGTVQRAGNGRVEIRRGDDSIFVEAEDVEAASLAALLAARSEADLRALAVLCLLEGDRDAARRLAGEDGVAARYWDYARDAASRIPKPSPREIEARKRFYAAEREFAKMETLAAGVAKYKSLAEDYADTAVVKGEGPRIRKRADHGRDYIFVAGGLKGTGTFGVSPAPRTEVAWVSKANVEGNRETLENYVEVEFAALPETAYKCWALVGGCCAETLVFYLQTTEGMEPHPRTKQKTSIDPGAELASLVKHSISGLKKTHEEHKIKGSKTHPKTAARWEWVTVPLPKYAGSGAKKIRLISDQQGFGVGAIVVSSTRTTVIPEPELKEEVARVRASAIVAGQEGLVGWWRFEETSGTFVSDAVEGGRPGVVHGNPKWTAGKVGGALKFEGADDVHIEGPYSFQTLTVSAWVKHDAFTGGIQRYVTVGNETIVIRCQGGGTAHCYARINGDLKHLTVGGAIEVGKWALIACTWDGTTLKLYKDGAVIGSAAHSGTITSSVPRIALGSTGEPMRGLIDEVRLYNRALTEAEIKKLYAEGSAGIIGEAAPAEAPTGKPWRPLFDGKSFDCIRNNTQGWRFESGAIVNVPGMDDAAQTREEIGDGELRIRFEVMDLQRCHFTLRQGSAAGYNVDFESALKSMEGKTHELIFLAAGDKVTATLDGKPHPLSSSGSAKSGCLQIGARGKSLRILSLDIR